DRVAAASGELLHGGEHVDGEALDTPVDRSETQGGVGVAGSGVEAAALAELTDLGAHPLGQLHRDLDVPGLVPRLASHVELEGEGRFIRVEVPDGAAGTLEGLDLTHEDAVHERAGPVGRVGIGGREPARALVVAVALLALPGIAEPLLLL